MYICRYENEDIVVPLYKCFHKYMPSSCHFEIQIQFTKILLRAEILFLNSAARE